jgi:hypothetical protein
MQKKKKKLKSSQEELRRVLNVPNRPSCLDALRFFVLKRSRLFDSIRRKKKEKIAPKALVLLL